MAMEGSKVISILAGRSVSRQIADLAFDVWLAKRFRDTWSEDELLHAALEVALRRRVHTAQRRFRAPEAVSISLGRPASRNFAHGGLPDGENTDT